MKASLFIVSFVLMAALVTAAPQQQLPGKLRRLLTTDILPENRKLDLVGGLVGDLLNSLGGLNPLLSDLLGVVQQLDVSNPLKLRAVVNALGLLRVKLLANLINLGGTYTCNPTVYANVAVADLVSLIVKVDLTNPTSINACVNALDVLCLNLKLNLLQLVGNLVGGVVGTVGDLLNILSILDPVVADLLGVIQQLDLTLKNLVNVRAVVNALGLLRVILRVSLLNHGGSYTYDPNVYANVAVADLLKVIAAVDLSNGVSINAAINALDVLCLNLQVNVLKN